MGSFSKYAKKAAGVFVNPILGQAGILTGMLGGSPDEQVTKNEPWGPLQPYLKDYYASAKDWYTRGQPLTAPVSREQRQAWSMGASRARAGSPLTRQAQTSISNILGGGMEDPSMALYGGMAAGGVSPTMGGYADIAGGGAVNPAAAMYGNLAAGGGVNPAMQRYESIAGNLGADPAAAMYGGIAGGQGLYEDPAYSLLAPTASGEMLGANPYLDEMFGRAAGKAGEQFQNIIAPSIASQFSRAGRYGSGAQEQAFGRAGQSLSETLGGMAANIYGGEYGRERERQLGAARDISGVFGREKAQQLGAMGGMSDIYGRGISQQLAATGGMADVYGQEKARQLAATGGLAGVYQGGVGQQLQALGGMEGAYGGEQARRLSAMGGMAGAYRGGMGDIFRGAEMAPGLAAQDYFDMSQLANIGQQKQAQQTAMMQDPMQRLQAYGSFLQPGSQFGTTTQPLHSNPLASALGGAAAGSAFGPWGAGIGAGLGLLAGR